jgi:glutaredoxin
MKKRAILYRMQTDKHICPYGLKSLDLLKREGFEVEDHILKTREETDIFKNQHQVETTPQTFIEGNRIGGYEDLLEFFGKNSKFDNGKTTSYTPIIAIFSVTLFLALALSWGLKSKLIVITILELFIAISMCVLAILKLRDLESFTNQFITYDILGMRFIRYGYVYPFLEVIAGLGMVSKLALIVVCPIAFSIGLIGAVSVFKAVYIEKRELKCACVGGDSNVPLGLVSLTENLMMIFMSVWMLGRYWY